MIVKTGAEHRITLIVIAIFFELSKYIDSYSYQIDSEFSDPMQSHRYPPFYLPKYTTP